MNALRIAFARLRGLVRRNAIADEIREELASHLDARIEQYEREGLTRSEAKRRAHRRVGNLAVHQDRGYDLRGGGALASSLRDLRWAWRGVRGRGWRAVFVVLLLGVTLAANVVVFAAADTFVFRTVPYADPDSLTVIVRQRASSLSGPSDYMRRLDLLAWRTQRDVFSGVEAHDRGAAAYLTKDTEPVRSQQVTPGMFSLLGVMPQWGRPLTQADAEPGAPPVVIIAESLARRAFGSANVAVGQSLGTWVRKPTVVGVMPASFRFPTAREEIWEPLNLDRAPDDTQVRHVARLAPDRTVVTATLLVRDRLPHVQTDRARNETATLRTLADFRENSDVRTVFSVLVAAAVCLLLIGCANVASLELAASAKRMRNHAIQMALGASRASIIRVGLFEGAFLLVLTAGVALGLTFWGSHALAEQLTAPMRESLANPLDLDRRALAFMVGGATATWLLTAVPSVLRASRASVAIGLRDDPRVMPVSRASARMRQVLMTSQVALTVILLVGALLYVRTYAAKVGRETGFDATRVATIDVGYAAEGRERHAEVNETVLARLRQASGVISVSRTTEFPPSTQVGALGPLRINNATESAGRMMISLYSVDPDYFRTLGITIVRGQALGPSSPNDAVVIDDAFARRYWPDGGAVGSRIEQRGISLGGNSSFLIVGVSRPLRADRASTPTGEDVFVVYTRILAAHPLVSRFVAKIDNEDRLPALLSLVRTLTERAVVRVDTLEARYARLEGDTRLAAAITTGFGGMAWLVATCGIYAVMAFLVAGRSREIGIRMALGADRADVSRMIFSSSLRFVVVGAIIGLGVAALASRFIAAQLFGVTPTDPLTYASVALLIIATAIVATWWPARRASRIDPAITLRSD